MKQLILISIALLTSAPVSADLLKCNLYYGSNNLTPFSKKMIQEKGYTLVKRKKKADFELSFDYQYAPYYLYDFVATITHLQTGMKKNSGIQNKINFIPDPLRSKMAEELNAAKTIEEYKAIQKNWESTVFNDVLYLSAGENSVAHMPSCASFYEK